mmetsp:Transcript_30689/g.70885  ORF Transcript_30689/g.70885 Transcript_30689/m.70885 type:complete len:508 (-) Transcript_30689:89-1612(-)
MRLQTFLLAMGAAALRDGMNSDFMLKGHSFLNSNESGESIHMHTERGSAKKTNHSSAQKATLMETSAGHQSRSGRAAHLMNSTDRQLFVSLHRQGSGNPHVIGGIFVVIAIAFQICFCCCILGLPFACLLRGHLKSQALREKLEHLKLKHPEHANKQPPSMLSDGMQRLAQEDCIIIKEKVNMLQELSGHMANFSIQTANNFDVFSVSQGTQGDQIFSCRETQDMQALIGMNLAGGLAAAGFGGAEMYAGRDKAPFRMSIGLPQPKPSNTMQVQIPAGVVPGQQIQITAPDGTQMLVAVPAGMAAGQTFPVMLPNKAPQQQAGLMQMAQGLVPGAEPNTDAPFLYLDRPFAFDFMCVNRPQVDVYDIRGGAQVKIGVISDPFAWMDMTFGIHLGPNATQEDPPMLSVRGAACQPGAVCQVCGLCCGRKCQEAYLEVVDPNDGDRTVAFITKGWAGGMQELFTAANTFYIDFGEVRDPSCKGLLLATALFVNYRFFEGKGGRQHSSSS